MQLKFRLPDQTSTPRPAGTPEPTFFEQLRALLPDWIIDTGAFFMDHLPYFFAGFLGALFIKILINYLALSRKQIEKVWVFVLFFLSKRQMMIPTVITLGKRKKVITKTQIEKLLSTRAESKKHPLKTSPVKRMKVESEISKILYDFFKNLDKKGELKRSRRLTKMAEDFEFIDQKLVELQVLYNKEADRWNQKMRYFFLVSDAFYPFLRFELFRLQK